MTKQIFYDQVRFLTTGNRLICSLLLCTAICIYPSRASDSPDTTFRSENQLTENTTVLSSDTTSNIGTPGLSTIDAAQANNSAKSQNCHAIKASLPKKVFSIATAFLVGTPVCIVRRTKYEEWHGVNGLIGDSDNKCKKILAGIFWLPCAAFWGTGEAPFDALANGLMYPAFSKDQLSQGKLIQNN